MADSTTSFARLVDDLVAGARADRDGVFNTLDAINRQTRAVSDRLAAQVDQFLASAPAKQTVPDLDDDRDTRFDPEDEWELPLPTVPHSDTQPRSATSNEDDDLPETWLR
jgi:hypothetical protein